MDLPRANKPDAVKQKMQPPVGKSAIGVFSQIMSDKMELNSNVEREKLRVQELHFSTEMGIQKERNEIEREKVEFC